MATGSIVDALKSQGKDSSYAARKKMAEAAGIKNYTGTAAQNTALLKTVQPTKTTATPAKTTVEPVKAATITPVKNVLNEVSSTSSDPTMQKYKDQYNAAKASGNKQGMIDAAEAADNYRTSQGGTALNTSQISRLKSENNTLDVNLGDPNYDALAGSLEDIYSKIASMNQEPMQTEEDYMSDITAKINALLKEQKTTAAANAEKARKGILTDADIAKQEMDDAYAQQLSELASQADQIRAAYASGKRGIETTRDQTLPTYDTAMNQQDILAQRQSKQLEGEFAQRGLQAGGQVTSELGQLGQENLSKIGDISTSKQNYISDTANKLADLEQTQTGGLTDLARAESTAAQTLSSGKVSIIKKVNAALSNLNTDEQALLDNLAAQRTQMLMDASQQYQNLSREERDAAFDKLLAQAGVAQDSVNVIRGLIDDKIKSDMYKVEAQIKELELQGLPEKQKLEIEKIKQDMKLNNISASQASAQIKLQQDKFKFDKEQQLTQTEREQYNNYINIVDSSSFVYKNSDGATQVKDKVALKDYIVKLLPDDKKYDNIVDSLLLRYGLPIEKD
jgi:hypothetical protein